MIKYPMTITGANELKNKLYRLKTIERSKIINALSAARKHGDLKENAEYHAAKEQHNFNERKIKEIENKLAYAQIVDISHVINNGRVIFGSIVHIFHINKKLKKTYKIVGEDEANIKLNKISYKSPIGKSLIGKSINDIISVTTPGGIEKYKILNVIYHSSISEV